MQNFKAKHMDLGYPSLTGRDSVVQSLVTTSQFSCSSECPNEHIYSVSYGEE